MKKEGTLWFQKQFKENLENEDLKSLQLPQYDLRTKPPAIFYSWVQG